MADSAADRARRSRRHKKGDHSLCPPERRCLQAEQAEATAAVVTAEAQPDGGYGPRGAAARAALLEVEGLGPLHRVLVDEACRIADRLDRLHAALESKGTWLRFETDDNKQIVIVVDGMLAEARQQASALRGIVAEIRAALPKPDGKPKGKDQPKGGVLSGIADELAARRTTAG